MTSEPETEAETSEVSLTVSPDGEDPNLWLEEVEGEDALEWVRGENERSLERLQADPLYQTLYDDALEIVNAAERIPYGSVRDGEVYNFWQDETNVRGLWRKTSLDSYATDAPEWETIVDFDALAEEGTISARDLDLITWCETAEEAWAAIAKFYELKG